MADTRAGFESASEPRRADFEPGARTRPAGGFRPARTFTETKAGFKTTEFVIMLAIAVAILIATYVADADLGANDGWRYISWVAAAVHPEPGPGQGRDPGAVPRAARHRLSPVVPCSPPPRPLGRGGAP